MGDGKSQQGSVEFIPATCPKCGGELRVPQNIDVVKCMYCGVDVILYNPNKIIIETDIDVKKLMTLAKNAERGENYQEAYQYYKQILEYDTENWEAVLGKGFAAGMLSTFSHLRTAEVIATFNKVACSNFGEENISGKISKVLC